MRALLAAAATAALLTGCAGGTPENVRARWAAREWAQRLHPEKLQVKQLQWDRDRAVVALQADARQLVLRLRERAGVWRVVGVTG
jgi:hypothetical protein